MAMARMLGTTVLALAVVGCAGSAPARLDPDSDVRGARSQLQAAAATGPVRLEVNGLPVSSEGPLGRATVETEAARGVRWMSVRFAAAPEATGQARLLLLFDPPTSLEPGHVCMLDNLPAPVPAADNARLDGVFCEGGSFVAAADASAPSRSPAEMQRLIWRVASRIFPDDYQDSYGFNLFGNRVDVDGSLGR